MKNILKRFSSLVLVALVILSLSVTALAVSPSITFEGHSKGFDFVPGSEYTESDLFNNFKNVMPGDVLTEEITFTNSATDCDFVHLYLRAELHDAEKNPLSEEVAETETAASMVEFLSQLSMKVWNGAELIYEASPDELGGLAENVLLGTFRTGETATLKVELTVPETLGNEFANRVGEVDWIFHVEAYNESQLTVRKVWSDGNANHADEAVTVNLLKDGNVETSVALNANNGWVFTFDQLVEGHTWTVAEANVPAGYTAAYETVGNVTTITNTKNVPVEPTYPLDVTVKKVWSNDDVSQRPDSVTVALYNGNEVYDVIKLSEENNWTFTWKDDAVFGNWQVTEINIPKGYTPSYRVSGTVVTITNTRELIYTGQTNWPVLMLGGTGLLLVAFGAWVMLRKKKANA